MTGLARPVPCAADLPHDVARARARRPPHARTHGRPANRAAVFISELAFHCSPSARDARGLTPAAIAYRATGGHYSDPTGTGDMQMNISTSIYESYGGMANVARLVLALYDKVLAAPVLAPYFARTDMRALVEHQSHFMASAMGGPASYGDAELGAVHAPLAITEEAFDCMIGLLRETLLEAEIAAEHVDFIVGQYAARRAVIVSR